MKLKRFDHISHEGDEPLIWNMQDAAKAILRKADANETLAFTRGLEHQFKAAYRYVYAGATCRGLIPVTVGDIPAGASSHTYTMIQELGEADVIDDYSADFPMADNKGTQHSGVVFSFGCAWTYSIQDQRRAAMLAMTQGGDFSNINTEKATTARKVFERTLDKYLAVGQSKVGLKGFANLSTATLTTRSATWLNAAGTALAAGVTPLTIKQELEAECQQIAKDLKGEFGTMNKRCRILMDTTNFVALNAINFSPTFTKDTIMDYLLNSKLIESIQHCPRLDTAGADGKGRIVTFVPDADILEAKIPVDFEQLAPQLRNMAYVTNCHGRFAGVVNRYGKGVRYLDGTNP